MSVIYVNEILIEHNINSGLVVSNKTAMKNIDIIFEGNKRTELKTLIKSKPADPFYLFARHSQYVIYLQYERFLGLSMRVYDFNSDIDSALDEYLAIKEKEWKEEDRATIIRLFQETQADKSKLAKMVVEDPDILLL
jgi:hypothetical protein